MEKFAESLHLPVIISGLSGGGKSTVASEVEKRPETQSVVYTGRLTTRALRPGEVEGKDGLFDVSHEEFDAQKPDMFFDYAKYDEQYGFLRGQLRDCLNKGNTFIIGGEPNTAVPMKERLNSPEEDEAFGMPKLKAVTVFVHRPLREVLQSIIARDADDKEKLKRLSHLLEKYTGDERTDVPADTDHYIVNGKERLEEAVRHMIHIIHTEREKQLKDLFGSSFALPVLSQ